MPDDVDGRFRSHKTYIESFGWIGGNTLLVPTSTALAGVAAKIPSSGALGDKKPSNIDLDQVQRSLRNAWSTEVLLGLPGEWAKDEDEFIRLSNTWGVVQAYYVGYHMTQALIVAKGSPRPTSHPKTQQQYATLWADRPIDLPPWTFGSAHGGWTNKPAAVTIDSTVHPWSACSPSTSWSLASKALVTTRESAVKAAMKEKRDQGQRARKQDWERDEAARVSAGRKPRTRPSSFPRPNLTAAEKLQCSKKVRTFTVLDYLYRLRLGANYDDASVFTDGPDNDWDSYLLHKQLTFLSSGLALVTEMRVRDLVGTTRLHRWADDFIAHNIPSGYSVGLKGRRQLL